MVVLIEYLLRFFTIFLFFIFPFWMLWHSVKHATGQGWRKWIWPVLVLGGWSLGAVCYALFRSHNVKLRYTAYLSTIGTIAYSAILMNVVFFTIMNLTNDSFKKDRAVLSKEAQVLSAVYQKAAESLIYPSGVGSKELQIFLDRPWTEVESGAQAWLSANQAPLALLDRAANQAGWQQETDGFKASGLEALTKLCLIQARSLQARGDEDAALRWYLTPFKLLHQQSQGRRDVHAVVSMMNVEALALKSILEVVRSHPQSPLVTQLRSELKTYLASRSSAVDLIEVFRDQSMQRYTSMAQAYSVKGAQATSDLTERMQAQQDRVMAKTLEDKATQVSQSYFSPFAMATQSNTGSDWQKALENAQSFQERFAEDEVKLQIPFVYVVTLAFHHRANVYGNLVQHMIEHTLAVSDVPPLKQLIASYYNNLNVLNQLG